MKTETARSGSLGLQQLNGVSFNTFCS